MLPEELQEILKEAKNHVLSYSQRELKLSIRKKIWKSLGDIRVLRDKTAIQTVGLKRRLKLAQLCVEKCIDKWQETIDDNNFPLKLMKISQQYINGIIEYHDVIEHYNDFGKHVCNIPSNIKYHNAISVGYGVIHMMDIALGDEVLILDNDYRSDKELNPNSWDTSYNACLAYVGGGVWDEFSDKEKRKEFWLWYIEEAVPKAYSAYSDELDLNITDFRYLKTNKGIRIINPTKEQIIDNLYLIEHYDSYLFLENYDENGIKSFITAGGALGEYYVEVRKYFPDGEFTEWMAVNDKGKKDYNTIKLLQYMVESFIEGDLLAEGIKWSPITDIYEDYF